MEAGDIVFYIDQIPHPVFRRRGNDLFVKQEVSLLDSLTGASVTLDHLNGEKVRLVTQEGDLLAPGAVRCVDKLGMPLYNQPGAFGKLYVRFQVKFPTVLSRQQREILRSVLAEPSAQGETEKPAVEAKVETEKPKEETEKPKVETEKPKVETEKPKEESKEESKEEAKKVETEKPKEESKEEESKEKPKEEPKKEEVAEKEEAAEKAVEPDSVEYVLQNCDQSLYGNPKLWDVESNDGIHD